MEKIFLPPAAAENYFAAAGGDSLRGSCHEKSLLPRGKRLFSWQLSPHTLL